MYILLHSCPNKKAAPHVEYRFTRYNNGESLKVTNKSRTGQGEMYLEYCDSSLETDQD